MAPERTFLSVVIFVGAAASPVHALRPARDAWRGWAAERPSGKTVTPRGEEIASLVIPYDGSHLPKLLLRASNPMGSAMEGLRLSLFAHIYSWTKFQDTKPKNSSMT